MSAAHDVFSVGRIQQQAAGLAGQQHEAPATDVPSGALSVMVSALAQQLESFQQKHQITNRLAALSRAVAQASHEHATSLDVRVSALELATERRRPATEGERRGWAQFLVRTTENTSLPEAQRAAIHDTWQLLIEREPAVMYPTAGVDDETGDFYFSWNLPRRSLEIQIAATGERSWFFADHSTGFSAESDEDHPAGFLTFLPLFLRSGA